MGMIGKSRRARFVNIAALGLIYAQIIPASSRADEPGWAGPGWYIWNKSIGAPALKSKEGISAGPYATEEECDAARPDSTLYAQSIPIFECFYFASESDFTRKLDGM